jgi:multisubunit Na+/H+ antiporter MnhB subunit
MGRFHLAHIALLIFAILIVLVLLFTLLNRGGWPRIREIYRERFSERHRERQFVAALSFYLSFATVRVLTHSIRAGRGPFHDVEVGGRHIHHLVWGILLPLIVGYGWLLQIGTDQGTRSRWPGRIMSLLYGIGAALTLDEFALWLNLSDVYWERQGRESIDAILLFGALLCVGLLGGRFLRSIAREALRAGRFERQHHLFRR